MKKKDSEFLKMGLFFSTYKKTNNYLMFRKNIVFKKRKDNQSRTKPATKNYHNYSIIIEFTVG